MLNQVKANEYNIKEMSASVLSLLKYVKTVSHDGHPGIEGDSPREEEEEQSPENPTEHFDNAVPENDPIAPSWTLWRNELYVLSSANVVCDFETGYFPTSIRICLATFFKYMYRDLYALWKKTFIKF